MIKLTGQITGEDVSQSVLLNDPVVFSGVIFSFGVIAACLFWLIKYLLRNEHEKILKIQDKCIKRDNSLLVRIKAVYEKMEKMATKDELSRIDQKIAFIENSLQKNSLALTESINLIEKSIQNLPSMSTISNIESKLEAMSYAFQKTQEFVQTTQKEVIKSSQGFVEKKDYYEHSAFLRTAIESLHKRIDDLADKEKENE